MKPADITVKIIEGEMYLEGIFPEYSLISLDLIHSSDPNILWTKNGKIYLKLSNAEAVYKRLGCTENDPDVELIHLERLEI